jgi:hypothetical protein
MICGEDGQPVDVEENSFPVNKQYTVTEHCSLYDSLMVDATAETKFRVPIAKDKGGAIGKTIEPKGGYVIPYGTSAWEIKMGVVTGNKEGTSPYDTDA